MENKRVSINLMLLVGIFIGILVIMFFSIKFFKQKSINENIVTNEQTKEVAQIDNKKEIENTELEEGGNRPKDSSKVQPIKIGEWCKTTKQENEISCKETEVRVTKITKGSEATKMVQLWEETKGNQIREIAKNMEWVVVEYEINLSNLSMSKNGNNSAITSKVEGLGNNTSVKQDNKIYEISTLSMSKDEYTTDTTAKGRFAMQLPIDCSNYIMIVGDGEQKAYIKGE